MALSTATTYGNDCVLMLHCDGDDESTALTDSSKYAHVSTPVGNAQIDTGAADPFSGNDGVAKMDGTGDWWTFPDHAAFDIGTRDFCLDFWVNHTMGSGVSGKMVTIGNPSSGGLAMTFHNPNTVGDYWEAFIAGNNYAWPDTISPSTWYHVALTRSGTTLRCFVDGVPLSPSGGSTSSDNIQSADILRVGVREGETAPFYGIMDEIRLVVGQAIWTEDFSGSLPSAPYTSNINLFPNQVIWMT